MSEKLDLQSRIRDLRLRYILAMRAIINRPRDLQNDDLSDVEELLDIIEAEEAGDKRR